MCVGSLAVGGSGKTPVTMAISKMLSERGYSVVIGCSGYGSPKAHDAQIAPEGSLDPAEWGDEVAMIRWLVPEIPLVVGRNRVMAADLVNFAYPESVLVMDDGFQHMPLKKNLSLVIDELRPKNCYCLPAGPYREPRTNRKRADILFPNRDYSIVNSRLEFIDPLTRAAVEVSEAYVLTAIGRPDKFLEDLRISKVKTPHSTLLPDHHPLDAPSLVNSLPQELPVITTAKDWVKIAERSDWQDRKWIVASKFVTIEPREEFMNWVVRHLNL